eukprot:3182940-Amphidinium_carterae.1
MPSGLCFDVWTDVGNATLGFQTLRIKKSVKVEHHRLSEGGFCTFLLALAKQVQCKGPHAAEHQCCRECDRLAAGS